MRRIWYSYIISLTTNIVAAYGFLFGASLVGFWQLVSVPSIMANLLNVKLGAVPQYIFGSLVHGQFFALCALGIMFFSLLSFGVRLRTPRFHLQHMQSV